MALAKFPIVQLGPRPPFLDKWSTHEEIWKAAETIYADQEYGSPWEDQFIMRCDVSPRTFHRWKTCGEFPGPVRAMVIAHSRCHHYGVPF